MASIQIERASAALNYIQCSNEHDVRIRRCIFLVVQLKSEVSLRLDSNLAVTLPLNLLSQECPRSLDIKLILLPLTLQLKWFCVLPQDLKSLL